MAQIELLKTYEPLEVEGRWYRFWLERGYFRAELPSDKPPYCIVLPPPNITGSLHLGHAVPATLQDILIRWKRMSGFNCLWVPGVDHAGIATQMMVERELKRVEGKSRLELGREEFLRRVWQWKEKYGKRIGEQHQMLGASLDWSRERFTMDAGSSKAVREAIGRLQAGEIGPVRFARGWITSRRPSIGHGRAEIAVGGAREQAPRHGQGLGAVGHAQGVAFRPASCAAACPSGHRRASRQWARAGRPGRIHIPPNSS